MVQIRPLWTSEEDEQVILWHKKDLSIREIAEHIPNRTMKAIAGRILILRRMKKVL